MEFEERKNELNQEIDNPNACLNTLEGFEIIIESFIDKIYDLFGRNALLSMTYQIGSVPGNVIAKRILEKRNNKKIEDPFEAMKVLLNENREFYSVKVNDIKVEDFDNTTKKLIFEIENRCFFRESLKKREKLKIGGPLCRVNKAYYEVAFKKLTGYKCEIEFTRNDPDKDVCLEKVIFYLPKPEEQKIDSNDVETSNPIS